MSFKRPREWPAAVYDDPLPQRLRDIGAGLIKYPTSEAVRHHYVPQFVMRNFAPADDARSIFRLQKRSGRYERVAIRAANQEEHLYGAKTAAGDYDNRVEGFLGLTENSAAPALESLRTGKDVSEDVILPLSLLLGLQQMRSPTALDAVGELIEKESRERLLAVVADREAFATLISQRRGHALTADELEEYRQEVLRLHRRGRGLRLDGKRNAGLEAMVESYVEAGYALAKADWYLLHPEHGSFVLNDVGCARFDEKDRLPMARGILYPLASNACLAITPATGDDCRLFRCRCSPDELRTINLRAYGWAAKFICGDSQHTVTTVRSDARKSPARARTPTVRERALGGP